MATAKGHEAKNAILVFRVKRNCVCFCVAFASQVDPAITTNILAQGLSCTIVAFILQPLQKDLAERLAGIYHTLSGPGLPFSVPPLFAFWTLFQNISRDRNTYSLLPQGTCSLRGYGTPGSGSHPPPCQVCCMGMAWPGAVGIQKACSPVPGLLKQGFGGRDMMQRI